MKSYEQVIKERVEDLIKQGHAKSEINERLRGWGVPVRVLKLEKDHCIVKQLNKTHTREAKWLLRNN
jgi:hypothetical protein